MINILYFARYRELLGCDQESFDLTELNKQPDAGEYSVAQLLAALRQRPSPWPETLSDGNLLIAVNQELSPPERELVAGDEVAFFPPVTGG